MARPRAGTKESNLAIEKWRKTMLKKYGVDGLHEKMQEIGTKGGRKRGLKGFALNPDLARKAGAKGGRISKRAVGGTTKKKVAENADRIEKMYTDGLSLPQISKKLGLSYATLYNWAKKNLSIYGIEDEIERCEKILEEDRDGRD